MKITLRKAIEEYLEYVKLKDKPQSYKKIKSRINLYIVSYFNLDLFVNDITTKDYLEYQIKINKLNISYKYKKTIHYTIVALLNYCIKFYDLEKNVASVIGNFKNNEIKKQINVWSNNDFKKYIKVINKKDYTYKILFKFLFYTGCRLGEACSLTWNNINKNCININKTITKEFISGERLITSPKTKTSNRIIYIDLFLRYDLYTLKKHYIKNDENFNENNFVFGNTKPLAPTTIERKKNNYCKIAKVKQIRIHDFRHSHATILLDKNIKINLISERLGHSDISMTFNTYIHTLNKDKKRVLQTLDLLRIF